MGVPHVVIGEKCIITTVSACLDGRWVPQVSVDLIAKITLAQGVAQLPYWLAHEFGILTQITGAH